MPTWCITGTLYKGLFILIFILIVLEYLFGSINESKNFLVLNTTKFPIQEKDVHQSHLLKTILSSRTKLTSTTTNVVTSNSNRNNNINNNATIKRLNIVNNNSVVVVTTAPPPLTTLNLSTINSNNTQLLLNAKNNFLNVGSLFDINTSIDVDDGGVSTTLNVSKKPPPSQVNLTVAPTVLPLCPDVSSNLRGRVEVSKSPAPTVQELEHRFAWLKAGGHWSPEQCRVLKKVAIIIPFRCRGEHLLLFLQHMHPFLKRQQLDYQIFIIEQDGEGPFNRAMLMNVGYKEALKLRNFDCFIFHDIDLLPEDDRNLYTCPNDQPRHMSVAVDLFKYRLPYQAIFGGVSAINREQFEKLNGFSNSFWGWGGEDDDMSNRIRYHNLHISRYPITIARYTMLTHKKDKPSPNRYDVLKRGQTKYDRDGLNNLNYTLVENKQKLLYTWLLVSVKMPS